MALSAAPGPPALPWGSHLGSVRKVWEENFQNAPLTESSFPLFIGPEGSKETLTPQPELGFGA